MDKPIIHIQTLLPVSRTWNAINRPLARRANPMLALAAAWQLVMNTNNFIREIQQEHKHLVQIPPGSPPHTHTRTLDLFVLDHI